MTQYLESIVDPRILEDLRLLVSELISNSVRHARLRADDWIELRMRTTPDQVRVEVNDPGSGFDVKSRGPDGPQSSGWGLYLVDRIADRWGVRQNDRTQQVWFELDRSPAQTAAS